VSRRHGRTASSPVPGGARVRERVYQRPPPGAARTLSLARPGWVTKAGAISGIVVGEGIVAAMTFSGATPGSSTTLDTLVGGLPPFLADLNLGVVALVANFAVTALVSMATRSSDEGAPVADDEPRFSRVVRESDPRNASDKDPP